MEMVNRSGNQPHDAFFKALLSQPGVTEALLRERLPPETVARLRLETARQVNASFIDDSLRGSSADLLLEVDCVAGARELVYVLIEHKSRPDRWGALQLLRYQVRIYERWHTEHPRQALPLITPMVVYHGEEPWNVPLDFSGLLGARKPSTPPHLDFGFQLVDIGQIPDEELSGHPVLNYSLRALKYGQRTKERVPVARLVLLPLWLVASREFFAMAVRYTVEAFQEEYAAEVLEDARRLIPKEESLFRTIADALLDRGRKIGRDEGLREGRREGLRKGLSEGLSEGRREGAAQGALNAKAATLRRQLAHRFGSVPAAAEQRIREAEEAQLDAWLDRILDAKSVEEVLADS